MTALMTAEVVGEQQTRQHQEWLALLDEFRGHYARAKRITEMRGAHIRRLTVELLGHEMSPLLVHNALVGHHYGRPWRHPDGTAYDIHALRLIQRMYDEMFHAHHLVDRWYDRRYPRTMPHTPKPPCSCSLPGWGR